MIVAGIDPGLAGAIALIDTAHPDQAQIFDMPVLTLSRGRKAIDAHSLARILAQSIGHAFVEDVHSMPKQGVASMFSFGKSCGVVIGALAALEVPTTLVAPRQWKAGLRVPVAKDGARARASQLLPKAAHQWSLKKHHGRAEATLMAVFGLRELTGPRAEGRNLAVVERTALK